MLEEDIKYAGIKDAGIKGAGIKGAGIKDTGNLATLQDGVRLVDAAAFVVLLHPLLNVATASACPGYPSGEEMDWFDSTL